MEKKYRKGKRIKGVDELTVIAHCRNEYVYLRDKVIHPSVIMHFQFLTIVKFLNSRMLFRAELNKEKK